jgi:diguanylate cyclase (GGDEF)-like protein
VYSRDGSFQGACEIIHRANSTRRGGDRFEELQKAATRDPLTGLANRAELEKHLAKVFADAQHPGALPFSAVFLDIDHFKSINDDHSHRVGDEVLKDISHLLEDELYSGELVARYGGEEFVVICPETLLADAVQRADRLRRAVLTNTLGGLKITASFGVAQLEEGDTTESVLRRADAALYEAKRTGRNRTCQRSQKQGAAEDSAQTAVAEDPYRFKTTLQATVAENMIATKLAGFVDANHAKVFDVTPEGFKVRLGDTTLFGGWGNSPDRQPVEVTVTIGKLDRSRRNPMVAINVLIEPRGRKPAVEVFQQRASHIREEIRAYCAAT